MAGKTTNLLSGEVSGWLKAWAFGGTQRHARSEFQVLQKLPDHLLKDLGLTRDQVDNALRLPKSQDASERLYRQSLRW